MTSREESLSPDMSPVKSSSIASSDSQASSQVGDDVDVEHNNDDDNITCDVKDDDHYADGDPCPPGNVESGVQVRCCSSHH